MHFFNQFNYSILGHTFMSVCSCKLSGFRRKCLPDIDLTVGNTFSQSQRRTGLPSKCRYFKMDYWIWKEQPKSDISRRNFVAELYSFYVTDPYHLFIFRADTQPNHSTSILLRRKKLNNITRKFLLHLFLLNNKIYELTKCS